MRKIEYCFKGNFLPSNKVPKEIKTGVVALINRTFRCAINNNTISIHEAKLALDALTFIFNNANNAKYL